MPYRALPEHLHSTADAAIAYFRDEWGVTKFEVEIAIDNKIEFCTTLRATTSDSHLLCIEVADSPYPRTLDAFVLDCSTRCLPVKLFVVVPKLSMIGVPLADIKRPQKLGVGLLEVDGNRVELVHNAGSLSLIGHRPIDRAKFPPRLRNALQNAEVTFRSGDPSKGCALLYDEIEAFSRKIASKTQKLGYWKTVPPKLKLDKDPWAGVLNTMIQQLDFSKCPPSLNVLLYRVSGITAHRNESGHKPKTASALSKRDSELRTRFEAAADLLADIISAAKPLHVL